VNEEVKGFPEHYTTQSNECRWLYQSLQPMYSDSRYAIRQCERMAQRSIIQWDKDDLAVFRFTQIDINSAWETVLSAIRKAFDLVNTH